MLALAFDTQGIDDLIARLEEPDLSAVGRGMDMAGDAVSGAWEAAAYGEKLPGMTRRIHMPSYASSVVHRLRGELEVVVSADPGQTDAATRPTSPWDMKPGLLTGPRARWTRSEPRHLYNVVPIRHRAEAVTNEALSALVQNLRNFRTEVGRRSKITPTGRYTWRTGAESGIRLGGTGPVTFRTVSERSPAASWWYPALPENPLIEAVWDIASEDVEEAVFEAWREALGF